MSRSKFRSGFKLTKKDREYLERVGPETIERHATDFIQARLAPAFPKNDGKQTPFKGHPVFKAQHATATCCRSCLLKWYGIAKKRRLTESEILFIKKTIIQWIKNEEARNEDH